MDSDETAARGELQAITSAAPTHAPRAKPAIQVPARRAELGCSLLLLVFFGGYIATAFMSALGLGRLGVFALALGVLAVIIAWPVMALFQQSLIVGDDGIQLQNFKRSRYVPFNEIQAIDYYPGGWASALEAIPYQLLVITLYNGQKIMAWGFRPRMEQAFLDSRQRHQDYLLQEEFEVPAELRNKRLGSLGRVAELKRIGQKEAGMRIAATDTRNYLHIAASPLAEPQDRLAAAIAISQGADAEQLQQLRIAAESAALPELRRAMGLCLDQRAAEENLAEALDELENSYALKRRGGAS